VARKIKREKYWIDPTGIPPEGLLPLAALFRVPCSRDVPPELLKDVVARVFGKEIVSAQAKERATHLGRAGEIREVIESGSGLDKVESPLAVYGSLISIVESFNAAGKTMNMDDEEFDKWLSKTKQEIEKKRLSKR
jgi:hypothetical protein